MSGINPRGSLLPDLHCFGQNVIVIGSAEEFVRLRMSDDPAEYRRSHLEAASLDVWQQVIERYPEMRRWVAHSSNGSR